MSDPLDDEILRMVQHHVDKFGNADAGVQVEPGEPTITGRVPSSVEVTPGSPEITSRTPVENPEKFANAPTKKGFPLKAKVEPGEPTITGRVPREDPEAFANTEPQPGFPMEGGPTGPRPGSLKAQLAQFIMRGTRNPEASEPAMPQYAAAPAQPVPPVPTPTVKAPPPDLSKPLGYQAPPTGDTELEGLQAKAKQGRQESRLGQASADLAGRPTNFLDYAMRLGGGGVSPAPRPTNLLAGNAEEGEQAISDLKERRASGAALSASAEDSDPNSPTAQTYRSVLLQFAPDLAEKLKGANAKQMRTIAPWLEKFAQEHGENIRAKSAAEAKAAQQAAADKDKAAALKLAGEHYEQGQKNSDRSYNAQMANAEATRGLQEAVISERKVNRIEDKTDKKEHEQAQRMEGMPPGIESVSGNPSDKDKESLKVALEAHEDLKRLSAEMKQVLGSTTDLGRMTGDERRDLNRIQAEMTIAAKNIGGLGQITAGDSALIDAIRPNATSGWSILRDRASLESQLSGLDKWGDNKVESGMKARGFRRSGASPSGHAAPERKQSKSGKWMVKDASGAWSWE